jgi:hypothetical protein
VAPFQTHLKPWQEEQEEGNTKEGSITVRLELAVTTDNFCFY